MEQYLELDQILRHRLSEIAEKNPHFSLRALARKLQISPSHLSRVLRGQKKFSSQSALRLARELDLSQRQTEWILRNHEKDRTENKRKNSKAQDLRRQRLLEFETFRLIADWYHFPILELIRTQDFVSDEAWISRRLALPHATVVAALQRLESLNLISIKEGKISLEQAEILETSDDIRNVAICKHHSQMLQKAVEALESQSVERREYQALNLNFNACDMKSAKAAIREFAKKFNKKFAQKSGEDIYQLNLQFFSLTQASNAKKK